MPVFAKSSFSGRRRSAMLATHQKVLQRCRSIIIKDLNVEKILDAMTSHEGLRADQCESILTHSSREERATAFLDQLETCSSQAFGLFMSALGERQSRLYGVLEETCRTIDDTDEWERSTMSGEAMRRLLRLNAKRRVHGADGEGEEGADVGREEEIINVPGEDKYVPCFTVTTRGPMHTEKWIKHIRYQRSDVEEFAESDRQTYAAILKEDVVFQPIKSLVIKEITGYESKSSTGIEYIIDTTNKPFDTRYKPVNRFQRVKDRSTFHSEPKLQTIEIQSSERRRRNNSEHTPPPPLPPKPDNFSKLYRSRHLSPSKLPRKSVFISKEEGTSRSKSASNTPLISALKQSSVYSGKPVIPPRRPSPPSRMQANQSKVSKLQLHTDRKVSVSAAHASGMLSVDEDDDYNMLNFNISVENSENLVYDTKVIAESNAGDIRLSESECKPAPVSVSSKQESLEIGSPGTSEIQQTYGESHSENRNKSSLIDRATFSADKCLDIENNNNLSQSLSEFKSSMRSSEDEKSHGDIRDEEIFGHTQENVGVSSATSRFRQQNAVEFLSRSLTDVCQTHEFIDSANRRLMRSSSEGPKSLSEIEVFGEDFDESSAGGDLNYEQIKSSLLFDATFSNHPGTYLYPRKSGTNFDRGDLSASVNDSYRQVVERDGRKLLYKDDLLIANTTEVSKNMKLSDSLEIKRADSFIDIAVLVRNCVDTSSDSSSKTESVTSDGGLKADEIRRLLEGTTLAYDKNGDVFYVPSRLLTKYGDPSDEKWFYPIPMTPHPATLFLNAVHTKGCFVIYRLPHADSRDPNIHFYLSVCVDMRGNRDVLHYPIRENVHGDVMISGHHHSFMTLQELVHYFRSNKSSLATRLRRGLREVHEPITPGYHFPMRYELKVSQLLLSGTVIGNGCYGVVCGGTYRGAAVAIKVLQKLDSSPSDEEEFIEEAKTMMGLRHENVIRLIGVRCLDRPMFIVTEYMSGGSLRDYLRSGALPRDNPDTLFSYCVQVVSAMQYLEGLHYLLHRDVAARNFLVSSEHCIKLADFGRARFVTDDAYQAESSERISIKWASPEVLLHSHYSTKSDVWAAGVVFWEIFSAGERPFKTLSGEQTVIYVTGGGRLDKPPNSPADIYSLMKSCWMDNPVARPSFSQIHEKLKSKSSVYYYRPTRRTVECTSPPPQAKSGSNSAARGRKGKSVTPSSDRKRWTLTSKSSF